jgi:hypothetical protein
MQNNRRNLGLAIIALGLIIIVLIFYFAFFKKSPESEPGTETPLTPSTSLPAVSGSGTTTPGDAPMNNQQYDISKETPHKFNSVDLEKIAMSFAERFGSYSNQSNYGNFTDLKIFMTDELKKWVDKYVADLKAQSKNSSSYYGIVTVALTADTKFFDEKSGKAQIVVNTQRRESNEKINGGNAYIQSIDIRFELVNDEWLVDEVYWEKK